MDKEKKERNMLYDWSCRNYSDELADSIFQPIDKTVNSYFVKCEKQRGYLHEYRFQTLPQLSAELSEMWGNEMYMNEVLKTVLVSAFKLRTEINTKKEMIVENECAEELTQYIYNF